MKTYVSDNFPLHKLECPYFEICKFYNPVNNKCLYGKYCDKYLIIGHIKIQVREILKETLEDYVRLVNLKFQMGLILDD